MSQPSSSWRLFVWVAVLLIVGFGGGYQCRDSRPVKEAAADPNAEDPMQEWLKTPLTYRVYADPPYERILLVDTGNGHLWLREPNRMIDLGLPSKPRWRVSGVRQDPNTPNRFNRLLELESTSTGETP